MDSVLPLSDLPDSRLRGQRALVSVDYNVPLNSEGEVSDASRITATLPTLRRLVAAGARVVLVSHMGRPDGSPDPSLSLGPVVPILREELGVEVGFATERPGSPELSQRIESLEDGEVVLLENIRFQPGETENDAELAESLGGLGDLFVGEAFGAAHRAQSSNVGAARIIRERGGLAVAGTLMETELRFLSDALEHPSRPFVAVMGGAKISGKIELIDAILPRVDRLLVGGAMANTFFRALGLETGASLVEVDRIDLAQELMDRAGDKLLLPVDVVVATEIDASASTRSVDRSEVEESDRIADIGPRTRSIFSRVLEDARTVLWNGPMGVFEMTPFAEGTMQVAKSIAEANDHGALTIVGGGDSAAAVADARVLDRMSHVSTGGGASLDLLSGKSLPGVDALSPAAEVDGSVDEGVESHGTQGDR
ncbi:MAG: phosphoglycerate kinase [Gemmatimonadales bacterium]|nr:MAG: phosphoglycerate kinase [Gemmatimonadales bacterium]